MRIFFFLILSSYFYSCHNRINDAAQVPVEPNLSLNDLINEYKDSIKLKGVRSQFLYKIASYLVIKKEIDSAFSYIDKGVELDTSAYLFDNGAFYALLKDKRWNGVEQKIFNKEFPKYTIKDTNVVKELWRGMIKDQSYFTEIIEFYSRKYGEDCKACDSIWKLRGKVTPIILIYTTRLIDTIGHWVNKSEYTNRGSKLAFLTIQHSNDSIRRRYLPLLEAACKRNEADYIDFARMKDRILLTANQLQIYGTQSYSFDKLTNTCIIEPTLDTLNLDKRRAQIGLEPMHVYYGSNLIYFRKFKEKVNIIEH